MTTIGQNQDNKAEWYVYNLNVDPDSLRTLPKSQLAARLDRSPKPMRRLKSNAAPMLLPAEDAPDICKGLKHGLNEMERRAAKLKMNAALCERLVSAFESLNDAYPPSPHIEKQIYDAFIEQADAKLMDAFHEADWSSRYSIVEEFQDPRIRTIGRQLIHLERPDLLDSAIRREHDLAAANRLLGKGDDISWLTLPDALQQLEGMLAAASGVELKLLREHKRYLRERHKQALMHVGRR